MQRPIEEGQTVSWLPLMPARYRMAPKPLLLPIGSPHVFEECQDFVGPDGRPYDVVDTAWICDTPGVVVLYGEQDQRSNVRETPASTTFSTGEQTMVCPVAPGFVKLTRELRGERMLRRSDGTDAVKLYSIKRDDFRFRTPALRILGSKAAPSEGVHLI